jgi:hypothetical protein
LDKFKMRSISEITKELYGELCWGVAWDAQLNMSMSFGEPRLKVVREPYVSNSESEKTQERASHRVVTVQGNWWLWIFCAHWKLIFKDSLTVTGASSDYMKKKAMARLDGQKPAKVEVNSSTGATEFTFDLGAKLKTRRQAIDESDIWTLYLPNGYVLSVRGDGTYTYGLGSTPGDEEIPIRMGMPKRRLEPSR